MPSLYATARSIRIELDGASVELTVVHQRTRFLDGQRCLFLHGNPGTIDDFRKLLPHLHQASELALVDLPGFGGSVASWGVDVSLESMAELVIRVADALNWDAPFYIVGYSHGGGIAQMVAGRYPERVAGIIVLATVGFPAHPGYRLLPLPGMEPLLATLASLVGRRTFRGAAVKALGALLALVYSPSPVPRGALEAELARWAHQQTVRTVVRLSRDRPCEQLQRNVARLSVRTLFVHGAADRLVPMVHARNVHRALSQSGRDSEFVEIADAGHMLPTTHPQALASLIDAVLAGSADNRP